MKFDSARTKMIVSFLVAAGLILFFQLYEADAEDQLGAPIGFLDQQFHILHDCSSRMFFEQIFDPLQADFQIPILIFSFLVLSDLSFMVFSSILVQ